MKALKNETSKNNSVDWWLLLPTLLLLFIGCLMVYSCSAPNINVEVRSPYYYFFRQTLYALIGMLILTVLRNIPYKVWEKCAYAILFCAIFLLVMVFSPLGHSAGGAARWLKIGTITFQPVEIARFALILFLAYSLAKKQENIQQFTIGFIPHTIILCIFCALLLAQPDLGSVVIFTAITWLLMFFAEVPLKYLIAPTPLLACGLAWFIKAKTYRMDRITGFMNPLETAANQGYQLKQSLTAMGAGGLWGLGPGNGHIKMSYLPEAHTDFIFSVIGEEFGLWGVYLVLLLFIILFFRGMKIAMTAPDNFGRFLAAGITVSLGIQVIINTGVTLGLMPTKGLALPFLSYGGSALIMNLALMGILMNIESSRNKER